MSIRSHIHGFFLHLWKFLPMKERTVIFLIRLSFCLLSWRRDGLYFLLMVYVRLFLNGSCLKLFSVLSVKLSLRTDGSVDRMSGSQSKYPSTSILSCVSETLWQSFLLICFFFFFYSLTSYKHVSFHTAGIHMHAASIFNIPEYSM